MFHFLTRSLHFKHNASIPDAIFYLKLFTLLWLNARSECNDIVISVYSHYPLDPNAKSSDTKCITLSIRWFCIRIKRVMTVYGNYDVIAFRSCIQILTVNIIDVGIFICLAHKEVHKKVPASLICENPKISINFKLKLSFCITLYRKK